MLRLFVALEIPEAQKSAIDAAIEPLRLALPLVRWTSRESWHVTLKFLGSTEEDLLPAVEEAVTAAAATAAAVRTRLTGAGAFPNPRRARVLWVGLEDGDGVLARLAKELEEGLEPLGFPREARPWRPHLTLARLKTPGPIEAALAAAPADIVAEPFRVGEIVLFRSHLRPSGAVYEPLARFPLGT
jgi:2'-5' RNA ligase